MTSARRTIIALLLPLSISFAACSSSGDGGADAPSDTSESPVADSSSQNPAVQPEPSTPEGPAGFTVDGTVATMSGVIGPGFDTDVSDLLDAHPDLTTIVLADAPGSDDDETNLRASLLVHEAGLTTEVTASSEIASGAVDFFLAGKERIVAEGARIGVHSWGGGDTPPTELPTDDEEHQKYLDYYEEIGIDGSFYWFTIEAAPAEDIHWMTDEEIARYGIATR